jgi:hypothetical protein
MVSADDRDERTTMPYPNDLTPRERAIFQALICLDEEDGTMLSERSLAIIARALSKHLPVRLPE